MVSQGDGNEAEGNKSLKQKQTAAAEWKKSGGAEGLGFLLWCEHRVELPVTPPSLPRPLLF